MNHKKYKSSLLYSIINLAFTALRAKDIDNEYYQSIVKKNSIYNIIRHNNLSVKAILIIITKYLGLDFGRFIYKCLYRFFYK